MICAGLLEPQVWLNKIREVGSNLIVFNKHCQGPDVKNLDAMTFSVFYCFSRWDFSTNS